MTVIASLTMSIAAFVDLCVQQCLSFYLMMVFACLTISIPAFVDIGLFI